jgi:hypothetical protein
MAGKSAHYLLEDVTPRLLLTRILEACGKYGTLREGEGASATTTDRFIITQKTLDEPRSLTEYCDDTLRTPKVRRR